MTVPAGVLMKLPGPRARGYFSTWPDMLRSAREIARQEPKPMKVLPSPQAISRMEETLTWNRFLEPDEAHLIWARADGTPWKGFCYRFGISRPTAHRRYDYALSVIVWRLNGRRPAAIGRDGAQRHQRYHRARRDRSDGELYGRPADAGAVPAELGVGVRQLNRLFRDKLGQRTMGFYRALRLEKARELVHG